MTYRALGLVSPMASAALAPTAMRISLPSNVVAYLVPRCDVGVNPLFHVAQDGDGGPRYTWAQHFLVPVGDRRACAAKDICNGPNEPSRAAAPGSNCIVDTYWSEAEFAQTDPNTYAFIKEERFRRLIWWLTTAVAGFDAGILAAAYDLSFCWSVTVSQSLYNAVWGARYVFDYRFPRSRWKKTDGAVEWNCASETCSKAAQLDQRPPPANLVAVVQNQPTAYIGQDCVGNGAAPVWNADIALSDVLKASGSQVVPTPWFNGVLNVFVPGWQSMNYQMTAAQMKKKLGVP